MADLTRLWQWERFVPSVGDNREQAKPFWFRVKACLSKVEMEGFWERLRVFGEGGGSISDLPAVFEGVVEMGDEPLSVNGRPVKTFAEYVETVVALQADGGVGEASELIAAVRHFNGVEGKRALFSERLSGGLVSIRTGKDERAALQTGGR